MLRAAGTDRTNLVRTDQYYATVKAVPAYQQVRREFLAGRIPPSTSITQQGLLLPGADMNIQALGIIPQPGFEVAHLKHEALAGRPTSGFSPALTVGDFIFVPGITASAKGDEPHRNGVAAAALMTEGQQWAGQPIKLETEFIIKQRIVPSLALAGATIDDIIHAQVYLTDRDDYSAFNETWSRHFAKTRPTLVIIPCIDARARALRRQDRDQRAGGEARQRAQKRHVDAGVPTAFRHQPQAVKAGDLLFMSGLMAIDGDGLAPRPPTTRASRSSRRRRKPRPNTSSTTSRSSAKPPARRSSNVVRVLQFHTDIDEFYPVYKVWERRLGGRPLPFSAVEVPAPLPVPGATVMIEAWAYAP